MFTKFSLILVFCNTNFAKRVFQLNLVGGLTGLPDADQLLVGEVRWGDGRALHGAEQARRARRAAGRGSGGAADRGQQHIEEVDQHQQQQPHAAHVALVHQRRAQLHES